MPGEQLVLTRGTNMADSDSGNDIYRLTVQEELEGVWSWSLFTHTGSLASMKMVRHSDKTYPTWYEAHTDGLRLCFKSGMKFMHTAMWGRGNL